jgi:hypothetical protein
LARNNSPLLQFILQFLLRPDFLGDITRTSRTFPQNHNRQEKIMLVQVALVSQTDHISFSALSRVAAALQKQVTRDVSAIWDIDATVDAFANLSDVPVGYWPITISDQDLGDAAGIHEDKEGQPFALVQYDYTWSLTTSHECLEMLVDPFGNRLVAGPSPMPGQGRVEFLVEVCDASEDAAFAYKVNGILVSDFYTPNFFAPTAVAGTRYSFTGAIKQPRKILKKGYISWHDPVSDEWFQQVFFGNKPAFRSLGKLTANPKENLRGLLYRHTPERMAAKRAPLPSKTTSAAKASMKLQEAAGAAKAKSLQRRINEVVRQFNS